MKTIPIGDHFIHRPGTTFETTTVEPPENPTNKGQDHLQDHPRPPAPGIGVGWGPCKGTTPPAPTATIDSTPDRPVYAAGPTRPRTGAHQ